MALLRFFKTPKHQRFGYIPRYWNPEKEELLERVKRAKGAGQGDTDAIKSRIRGGFKSRGGYVTNDSRARQTARSNMILVIVIFALIVVSYLALGIYLPKILQYLE
ncbi:MAG: hypothetical protein NXI23_14915 [Bacteroidetes bacterium]|jgi:hypothetical protein|nr:hypothetical protein [Bacteroidota bacterium]MDF1863932.1 hypothetical protein [Saprospiraceae bacterium]